jgi:hypothetical protein
MTLSELKQVKIFQVFTIFLRYLIGSAFVFSSIVKIRGERFTTESGANDPINSAWHYFETMYASGIYWNFIGWGQMIAGFLLMTQRWSTVGALIFLPIIANIFFVTISYEFGGTPVITSLMFLANLYLLVWDYNKLQVLFSKSNFVYQDDNSPFSYSQSWIFLGIFFFILTIIIRWAVENINQYFHINPFFFMLGCFVLACLIGFGIVVYEIRKKS